jgi:hypothetical protein
MQKTIIGVAAALCVVACHGSNDSAANSSRGPSAGRSAARVSSDSVVIRTTDGTINLGLARDTVFMGLTDSVLAVARNDMARDTEERGSAFGRTIERFVKTRVSSALQTRLKYPITDLDSATYQNGAIKFAYRNRRTMAFESVSQNGHKALESFAPTDAQRFVATLNSAIRAERGGVE